MRYSPVIDIALYKSRLGVGKGVDLTLGKVYMLQVTFGQKCRTGHKIERKLWFGGASVWQCLSFKDSITRAMRRNQAKCFWERRQKRHFAFPLNEVFLERC